MKRYALPTAIGLTMAALPGCGGGGYTAAGSGGGMNLASAPGDAALEAYVQANHSATLHATDSAGNSWTLQYSSTANAGTTTFEGMANAHSTTDTIALDKNGAPFASNTSSSYFFLNPFVPLGKVNMGGTPYAVVTSSFPLPATVTVGGSGEFDNLTYYHDQTKTLMDAQEAVTYSVAANDSSTLLLCFTSVISNVSPSGAADGMAAGTETDCYAVDASGNASISSITVTAGATTIKFQ